jgi:hypothetical protein
LTAFEQLDAKGLKRKCREQIKKIRLEAANRESIKAASVQVFYNLEFDATVNV